MVLNEAVVPKNHGMRLPLYSELSDDVFANGFEQETEEHVLFCLRQTIDALGEPLIHIERLVASLWNLANDGMMG